MYQQAPQSDPYGQNHAYQQAYPQGPAMPPPPDFNQAPTLPPSPPQAYNQPANDFNNALFEDNGLSDKLSSNTRLNFIRKVLGILCAQLTLTAIGVAFSCTNQQVFIPFIINNIWLTILAAIFMLITLYALGCYKTVARSVPTNYILLFIFTLCETYLVMGVTTFYDPEVVMAAAILTAVTVGALAVYAVTTKEDFTYCGGAVWAFFFIILTGTLLCIFMRPTYTTRILLSCLIIFICCFYIIYDIQLITGEKAAAFSIDDYVFAAMVIYIDIIRLFIEILRVLGKK